MMFNKLLKKLLGKAKPLKLYVPAIAGIALISIGVALVCLPAGIIISGLFLLWIDYRL